MFSLFIYLFHTMHQKCRQNKDHVETRLYGENIRLSLEDLTKGFSKIFKDNKN